MTKSAFYPYPARPGTNPDSIDFSHICEPSLLTDEQVSQVVDFEHRLYDLQLDASVTPRAANYMAEQEEQGKTLPTLESIWRLKTNRTELGLHYFLTNAGKDAIAELTDEPFIADTVSECSGTLARLDISKVDSKTLDKLEADSIGFEESRLTDAFIEGGYKGKAVPPMQTVGLYKNPEALVTKIAGYRQLKTMLGLAATDVREGMHADTPLAEAELLIIGLYRRRINRFIADGYIEAYKLLSQHNVSGGVSHGGHIAAIAELLPAFLVDADQETIARTLQRMDRYNNGVALNKKGKFTWLSEQATELVSKSDKTTEPLKVERGLYNDIDPNALSSTQISGEIFGELIKQVLTEYDLLSAQIDWSSERTNPADDNKWQVIVNEKFKSLAVNDKQRVVKVPAKARDLLTAIQLANHEISHVLQHESKRAIGGLAILRTVNLDNVSEQTEAGGLWQEQIAQQALTGLSDTSISGVGYMRAIQQKSEGASFGACVEAYYKDLLVSGPKLSSEKLAAQAVNRARRVFRSGGFEYAQGNTAITNTQPLSYLEQRLIYEELPEDHRNLLLVGGITIRNFVSLEQYGLVDGSKIIVPKQMPWQVMYPMAKRLVESEK